MAVVDPVTVTLLVPTPVTVTPLGTATPLKSSVPYCTDSFSVTSADGTTKANAVTVTIAGTNDAPVVSGQVVVSATEDDAVVTVDALANASDVDHGAVLILRDQQDLVRLRQRRLCHHEGTRRSEGQGGDAVDLAHHRRRAVTDWIPAEQVNRVDAGELGVLAHAEPRAMLVDEERRRIAEPDRAVALQMRQVQLQLAWQPQVVRVEKGFGYRDLYVHFCQFCMVMPAARSRWPASSI